jgi:DNA-binding Xre family transcriptional regulator
MTNGHKIRIALAHKGMSEAELARAIGTSPSAFNQRLKTDKFKYEELEKIATVLDCTYKSVFVLKDGTEI